jgi:predicted Zn-dependent protease
VKSTGFAAHYLDGQTPVRRRAWVRVAATGLEIAVEGGATLWWPLGSIRQTQGIYAGEPIRLELGGTTPAALVVDDPALLAALRSVGEAGRRFHGPRRPRLRVLVTTLAALGVVATGGALYVWGIPAASSVVASILPVSWEDRIGRAAIAQLAPRRRQCQDSALQATVDAIVTRLVVRAPDTYRIDVTIVDDPAVNAFAAPGGHIVVLRGLLERARTPEELAGVLAHEIQHVYHRHPTRLIVQHTSAGLLMAAVAGDVSALMAYSLEAARILGTLRYSRQYEAEADAAGLRMLATARIDPRGLSSFLEQLAPAEKGAPPLLAYFTSHPTTGERIATLERLAAEVRDTPTPIVTGRDWKDVVRLCGA